MQAISKSVERDTFKSSNGFFFNNFFPALKKGLQSFLLVLFLIFLSRIISHWFGIISQTFIDFTDIILALAVSSLQILLFFLKKFTIKS